MIPREPSLRPAGLSLPTPRRTGSPTRGLSVRADFEGGNVDAVEVLGPDRLRFAARADGSPRPLWFYFRIEGTRAPLVRCELTNADDCLGPREGWETARPVYSPDGISWHRVAG